MRFLIAALLAAPTVPAFAAATDPAIQSTLTAMNDGVGIGAGIIDYIESSGIQVEFARIDEPARTEGKKILLSDRLPHLPRILAIYIASEVAPKMLSNAPAGAERDYMIDGTMARAWMELGGERAMLPRLDPSVEYADGALASRIHHWDDRFVEYLQHPPADRQTLFWSFFEIEKTWRMLGH